LDALEDEEPSDGIYEKLLEESRATIGERSSERLNSFIGDPDSLYEMLLRETTQEVQQSLQESSGREMKVRAWWDNIRAQLRDEGKPSKNCGQLKDKPGLESPSTLPLAAIENSL